MRAILF